AAARAVRPSARSGQAAPRAGARVDRAAAAASAYAGDGGPHETRQGASGEGGSPHHRGQARRRARAARRRVPVRARQRGARRAPEDPLRGARAGADVTAFAHITRCLDLVDADIAAAIGTREATRALLGHLAARSAPNTGAAKVLLVLARMATTA